MSRSDLVPLLVPENSEMDEPDAEREVQHPFIPATNCTRGICMGTVCQCDNFDLNDEDIEESPLISYHSETPNSSYFTDVHCHEFRPIFSNKNARRKLTVASIVCLFFVIAEAIGKYSLK
jgi:hypothetical protein